MLYTQIVSGRIEKNPSIVYCWGDSARWRAGLEGRLHIGLLASFEFCVTCLNHVIQKSKENLRGKIFMKMPSVNFLPEVLLGKLSLLAQDSVELHCLVSAVKQEHHHVK